MLKIGWKLLKIVENKWSGLKLAEIGWKWLQMDENCLKQLKQLKMVENGWKLLKAVQNSCKLILCSVGCCINFWQFLNIILNLRPLSFHTFSLMNLFVIDWFTLSLCYKSLKKVAHTTHTHTHTHTDGNHNLETESAQRADSVKSLGCTPKPAVGARRSPV